MAFQPVGSLNHRTFSGLIIAQFLAGFNDQAIHASAMFFALHRQALTEEQAISLMPILFFAPWAIFCTLAGFCADRYSKTYSLVFWKCSEIVIALIAMAGFWLGSVHGSPIGPWLVLSTVFLMGTHAAFFAPAKYGAMPEILQPHVLSRGNGVLESTTFLAAILGTVTGGLLSSLFRDHEIWIGVTLLVLAIIGAAASFLIARLPPANPTRTLPPNIFKPLIDNLKVLMRSKALALSVLGIAFFVFMVAYMRQTMYMHGETRNPRWDEFHTSVIVATVALGVGLGAPLAGYLSGGKVELGMVPLGCVGMILATLIAAFAIEHEIALTVALIIMGFFSGFYMVPLYTLLQHRAPKASKGDLVATSNFINVTGAMAASALFFVLVVAGRLFDVTPVVAQRDEATGVLENMAKDSHGRIKFITIRTEGAAFTFKAKKAELPPLDFDEDDPGSFMRRQRDEVVIDYDDGLLEIFGSEVALGSRVTVSEYVLNKVEHFFVRPAGKPQTIFDKQRLPQYLFFGAALMTTGILLLLWRQLPDFFVRTLFWLKSLGRFQLKAVGMQHLPTTGPVILATNCDSLERSLQLNAVTDRCTIAILVGPSEDDGSPLLRQLALRRNAIVLGESASPLSSPAMLSRATAILDRGDMLALSINGQADAADSEEFLRAVRAHCAAPLLPVYCGPLDQATAADRIRVVFGPAVAAAATLEDLKKEIDQLADWIRHNDDKAGGVSH
jgi:MFS family permease